ncbi:peptidoglycan DD-metalloendopeptidase family protein [Microbaculum marinisediminis]|uniref:Peptidoglycan DD-metalloendopeptidase family protein n=1 Tax=Microbaculum marinisediminis TaxID=2931392 RepID=A0AAW5R4H0_9HYPH|nr:peptidoglycan DD-metalloendopeptidase family protein [Microbaculum sp. A6E488]MCT8974037.1 peptidoglycan DD-metalloendopeptidase family protein [Microbaculum sp. A6E488]
MRSVIGGVRQTLLLRVAIVGALGALAAGCSSDVTRFSGGSYFGGDPGADYTGSIPPEPIAGAAASNYPAQPAYNQPASNQLGSAPATSANGSAVTVAPGETAFTIATRYGVPAPALMKVNGLSSADAVQPGQQLVIPVFSQPHGGWVHPSQAQGVVKVAGPTPASAARVATTTTEVARPKTAAGGGVHTVSSGETVYSLSRAYGVSPNAIIAANDLQAPYGIRIGQKVRIPGAGTQVATAAPAPKAQTNVASAPAPQPAAEAPKPEQVAAVAPAPVQKSGIESSNLDAPEPQKVAYAPQNDSSAGTSTRAGVPEPAALSAGNFRWPVRGRVISSFGEKGDGGTNDGINVSVPEGTSVRAAENGVVAYAGNELKGYGNLVLIRHADDWVTAYAHNSELLVKRGDVISRGQVIAKAGQTGSVSTPQMHFELRKGSTPVDPLKHLASD